MTKSIFRHPMRLAILCLMGCLAASLVALRSSGIDVLAAVFPPQVKVDTSHWGDLPVTWPTDAPLPAACNISGPLPDPQCTQNTTIAWIGQDAIRVTVCEPLWVQNQQAVYLPERVADPVRARLAAMYHKGDPRSWGLALIEPLGLAGNAFYGNFMLLPPDTWRLKQAVDDAANRAVCAGRMTLPDAQERMQANWANLGRKLGVNVPTSVG